MSDFEPALSKIREHAARNVRDRYPLRDQADFDVVRRAMVVAQALDYLGANVPEARELVGEVEDLVMRLRQAKTLTPMLETFF